MAAAADIDLEEIDQTSTSLSLAADAQVPINCRTSSTAESSQDMATATIMTVSSVPAMSTQTTKQTETTAPTSQNELIFATRATETMVVPAKTAPMMATGATTSTTRTLESSATTTDSSSSKVLINFLKAINSILVYILFIQRGAISLISSRL